MSRNEFFDALNKGARWDVGVSISRTNPLPLDDKSVFKTYADLETYAAGVLAYPGQVVAVVGETSTTIYYLDQDLAIKQVGIIPTGDSKTISVTEDGQISLLVEKGADIKAGAQLTLTADGKLKWTNPDTSTAEGQDAAIKALQATVDGTEEADGLVDRMATAEADIDKVEKAIADEVSRADTAEKALDEKIAALNKTVSEIDFVDADELADAIEAARKEISKEIDDNVKAVADTKLDTAIYTAEKTAFETAYAADKKALEDEDAAIRVIAEKAASDLDFFLNQEGLTDKVDSVKEILEEISKMTDAEELAGALSVKADKSYVDEELAKKADAETVNTALATKADAETINTELAKKADKETVNAALATKADAEATTAALATKADAETVNTELAKKADKETINTALDTKANASDVYTKSEVYTKEEIAALNHATTQNVADAVASEAAIARAAEEANAKAIKAISDDYLTASDKTELSNAIGGKVDSTKYAEDLATTEAGIAEAKRLGNQGITDAATAKAAADGAQQTANTAVANANTNTVNIKSLQDTVNGAEGVTGLVSTVATHENRIGTLEGTVKAQGETLTSQGQAIATKAEQSDLNAATGRITTLEGVVGDSESGLVKTVAGHTTTLADHENRIGALEIKVDNDTTYTFENGTEGTFKVTPKDGVAQTIETGAKAYADSIVASAKSELNGTIASTKGELEGSINGLDGRLDTAEADIDELQLTIQGLSGAMHFRGVVEADPTSDEFGKDGYADGDVVIFGNKEFVFNKGNFTEFGDASGNASAISALDKRVGVLEAVKHDEKHAETLAAAKSHAENLTNLYATAEQGRTADSAIQTVAASEGLTATVDENDATKVTIGIDADVVFIFNGGSATSEW